MDSETKAAFDIIINNQKELLEQQRINNMLLLANNPNLSSEMQQKYMNSAMIMMGLIPKEESLVSHEFIR